MLISIDNIFAVFLAALLSFISFFLIMFYKKVNQIADDITYVKTTVAVRDEQMKGVEKRLTILETIFRDISKNKI